MEKKMDEMTGKFLLKCKNATSECYKKMCNLENEIITNNDRIGLLSQKLKHLKMQFDKKLELKHEIPKLAEVNERNKLNKYITKEDAVTEYIDMKAKYLYQTENLKEVVSKQQNQIKALKKILLPRLIEQIKLELEKDINMDENKEFKKQIGAIDLELYKLSSKKDNLSKQMEKYDDAKKKVTQNYLDKMMSKMQESISALDNDRKSYYETEAKKFAKLKEMYGWEKYTQNIIMLTLQSFGDVNQISYENMKNKVAKHKVAKHNDEIKKLVDSLTKAICKDKIDFKTLAQLGENLIFETKLLDQREIKIKDMVNNKAGLEDFKTMIFDNKLDELKKSFDEVRNLSLLNLILSSQYFDLEKLEKNITEETRSQNYFWPVCQNEWRIESYEQEIQKYKNLTSDLIKIVPAQNQNHGIFNMIHNAQNQNNNDIPQMENNIINEKQ